jgi:hypothetical protein
MLRALAGCAAALVVACSGDDAASIEMDAGGGMAAVSGAADTDKNRGSGE